jgi:type II secretory pathway pseudopilin PulG
MVVLFLIVLILALATPFFAGRLPAARLDATAREISAAMRHARTLARGENERKAFIIDLDARQYGIDGLSPRSIPPDIEIRVTDPVAGEVVQGRHTIRFYASGASEGGAIRLTSGRRKRVVETDPVIGAVVIK